MGTDGPPPTFATLLRRSRLAAGLTQEELAERARLSVRGITDLERGARRAPHKETVHLLADALGLTPDDRAAFERAVRLRDLHPSETPSTREAMPALPGTDQDVVFGEPAASVSLAHGGFLGALPAGPLVGRQAELQRVLAALTAVAGGQGRLVLLAGEPGVGKTRLAQEVMLRARERGFHVLVGRCYEQHAALPFFVFTEALAAAWCWPRPPCAPRHHAASPTWAGCSPTSVQPTQPGRRGRASSHLSRGQRLCRDFGGRSAGGAAAR